MEDIYRRITNKKYCRKNPEEETKIKIINAISVFRNMREPLKFVVLFGGYKNPDTGLIEPGLSEIMTIKRLADLMKKIEISYPYNVQLNIVTTGRKGEIANGILHDLTSVYEKGIKKIAESNFANIKVIPIGEIYESAGVANEAKLIRNNVIAQKTQTEKIGIAKRHNLKEISEEEAVINVSVYESLTGIEPIILKQYFGDFIKLSFRQYAEDGAISMFTCKKGMVKQPWNGSCRSCKHANHCESHFRTGKIIYS